MAMTSRRSSFELTGILREKKGAGPAVSAACGTGPRFRAAGPADRRGRSPARVERSTRCRRAGLTLRRRRGACQICRPHQASPDTTTKRAATGTSQTRWRSQRVPRALRPPCRERRLERRQPERARDRQQVAHQMLGGLIPPVAVLGHQLDDDVGQLDRNQRIERSARRAGPLPDAESVFEGRCRRGTAGRPVSM